MQYLTPYLKFNNVFSFSAVGVYLYVQQEEELTIYKNGEESKKIKSLKSALKETSSGYVVNGRNLSIYNGEIDYINIPDVSSQLYFESLNYGQIALIKSTELQKFFFIDLFDKSILWSFDFSAIPDFKVFFNDKIIVCTKPSETSQNIYIAVYSFFSGKELWQFDLRSVMPDNWDEKWGVLNIYIKPFIIGNLLIVTTFKSLVALDVDNGTIVYNKPYMGIGNRVVEKDKIYTEYYISGGIHVFQIINACTGELIKEKTYNSSFFTDNEREQPVFTEAFLYEKYLVFSMGAGYKIYFMNKESLEIEKVFSIKATAKEKRNAIRTKPVIANGTLYQLDGNNNLYAFKMEGLL